MNLHNIKYRFEESVKMTIFTYFRTNNPIIDTILSTAILSLVGYLINSNLKIDYKLIYSYIEFLFKKKHTIVLEGKNSTYVCKYRNEYIESSLYSDNFNAILDYITKSIDTNSYIYNVKELNTNKSRTMNYIVNQFSSIQIDPFIYMSIATKKMNEDNEEKKSNKQNNEIVMEIYSYKHNLQYLKSYVENIRTDYMKNIHNEKEKKRYIYTLENNKIDEENGISSCWSELTFESTRTFDNLFFENKENIMNKIDFFINNKAWYYEKGIPYTLGIGLYGPPGTGKTSFIKALANYTNRNIIVLSFKLIKTKSMLNTFFFENTYSNDNEKHSVGFDKKIIVFEDIDCLGDIVLERGSGGQEDTTGNDTVNITNNVLHSFIGGINNKSVLTKEDDPIKLDDLLNILDGIRETPGRILVITSNYYEKLDSALKRPGRIDITQKLDNVNHYVLSQIYYHLTHKNINKHRLIEIAEYFFSPAEIINIYLLYREPEAFIDELIKRSKDADIHICTV